ncbi:ferredoxin [Rhodococcus sp. NPDC019627]|uniref:ferredoxin n=1 Tax=unclassified Rhodococcus (in: high G+C Gram-positive bacteria) TaxID=192944 RepID=UPI0033C99B00
MNEIVVDLAACQGYGNCVIAADDTFDMDDDGLVLLLRHQVPATDLERVAEAVSSCPVQALSIRRDDEH